MDTKYGEWVDVNESMPEPNEYVLVNTMKGVTTAKWDGCPPNWGIVSQPDEPLSYSWHNMQTDILNLNDDDRASFSIIGRVTHWTPLPKRPDVEYKIPREWSQEEQQAYAQKQIDGLMRKYSGKNYELMMEMLSKTTINPESNEKL
jgi:hypothetical protein